MLRLTLGYKGKAEPYTTISEVDLVAFTLLAIFLPNSSSISPVVDADGKPSRLQNKHALENLP